MHDLDRRNMTEMKVRGEAGSVVAIRQIARIVVMLYRPVGKRLQSTPGGQFTGRPVIAKAIAPRAVGQQCQLVEVKALDVATAVVQRARLRTRLDRPPISLHPPPERREYLVGTLVVLEQFPGLEKHGGAKTARGDRSGF